MPMTLFWLIVSLAIALFYLFTGGLSYINCFCAVKGYLEVFSDEDGKLSIKDIGFFIVFPITLAAASQSGKAMDVNIAEVVCVVISILTAMIYSFMAVISPKYERLTGDNKTAYITIKQISNIYKETMNIILCEVLASVLLLILCFIQPIIGNSSSQISTFFSEVFKISAFNVGQFILSVLGFLIYFFFYFFILNILIVTKRFYKITEVI